MKLFCVIFIVVSVALARPMTDEQKEALMKLHEECAATTGIEDEDFEKSLEGDIPDDEKFKEHVFCIAEKKGIINEEGEIQESILKEKLKEHIDDDTKVDEIISKCVVEKGSPQDTAYEMVVCIHGEKEGRK